YIAPAALSQPPAILPTFRQALSALQFNLWAAWDSHLRATYFLEKDLLPFARKFSEDHRPEVFGYVHGIGRAKKVGTWHAGTDDEHLDIRRGGQILFHVFQAVYYGFPRWTGSYWTAVLIAEAVRQFHRLAVWIQRDGVRWTTPTTPAARP